MNNLLQRYVAAVVGFGFVAVWISAGVTAAFLCLVGSALFYSAVVVVQQKRLSVFTARFMEDRARRDQPSPRRTSRPTRSATRRPAPTPRKPEPDQDDSSVDLVVEYGW